MNKKNDKGEWICETCGEPAEFFRFTMSCDIDTARGYCKECLYGEMGKL